MHRLARIAVTVAAPLTLVSWLAAPATEAATTTKTATATATSPVISGGSETVSITLTNTTKQPQSFGSANITPPAVSTITAESIAAPVPSGFFLDTSSTSVVQLRSTTNSGIAPGGSITMSVTVASGSACGSTWAVRIKQSNDFSGTGNDFVVNNLTIAPASTHLAFTTQPPAATEYDIAMSPAVVVSAVDACGNPVNVSGTVTLTDALGDLSPTPQTATLVNGAASFANVTFTVGAINGSDSLFADSAGYTRATSTPFDVVQKLITCPPSCDTGPVSDKVTNGGTTTTVADVTVVNSGSPQTAQLSVKPGQLADPTCGQPTGNGEVAYGSLVTVKSALGKTVTMTLPKSIVQTIPNNGTPFYDICLSGSTQPFTDKFGNPNVTTGLLADCSVTGNQAPCIVSRNKTSGDEIVVFTLVAGDPTGSWFSK